MKILRVIASMDPGTGGPCQGVRYSIPVLESLGCTNEVVCLDDPAATFLQADPFVIHALGQGRGPLRYHPALLPWLTANLSRFDAVIVHGLWLWPSIATWIASQRLRKKARLLATTSGFSAPLTPSSQLPAPAIPPYFVMPHGMLDPWFQKDKSRKLKAFRNSIYWHLIENKVIRDASGALFTCEKELQLARTSFLNYKPRREMNVGYGVPDSPVHSEAMDQAFYQQSPALPKDHPFLLFLSRIHPKKGVDLLIQAYAEVFRDLPSGKSEKPTDAPRQIPALVIAGPIDSDYAREMICLAESLLPGSVMSPQFPSDIRLPISDQPYQINRPSIHFTGMLQGLAKWGALYRCEVFVLPSHQENFGISVAEALSCSKPVLISCQVNIAPEISADCAGLVGKDDLEGVTSLLRRWKEAQLAQRAELTRSAYACFISRFGITSSAGRLLVALREGYSDNSFTPNPS